jgi:glucose/arabinose dehydrogenase
MKQILTAAGIALILFACRKDDLRVRQSLSEENSAQSTGNLQTKVLNDHLNFPWEILWGPDNFIWFTEREGRVNRMNPATGEVTLVATIKEVASTTDFNGLLGMVLHPQFSTNPFVYVVYNYFGTSGDYLEKIVQFTYDGKTLISPLTIVDGIVGKEGGDFIHNGSRLIIGPDMKLYATTGDANQRFVFPQDPNSLNGKVLRVNLDGSIPPDNPFGNAVWAIGQRNRRD